MNYPGKNRFAKKIGFGLVGTGMIAPYHMRAIRSNKNASLVGIFSRSASRGKEFAKRFGVKHYLTYLDMLKDDKIDVIDIVTCSYLHAEYGIRAIQFDKHVIVEKPIDVNIEKAEALIKIAEEKGKKISCVSQFRFSPGIVELRNLVKKNILKSPYLINVTISLHRGKDYFEHSNWRSRKEYAGGGVILMNAIHIIDILLWIFGPAEKICFDKLTTRAYINVEDCAAVLLKFDNGTLCTISANNVSPSDRPVRIEVYGNNKFIMIDDFVIVKKEGLGGNARYLNYINTIKSMMQKKVLLRKCFYYQVKDMVDAIQKGTSLKSDGISGVKALKAVNKTYSSRIPH